MKKVFNPPINAVVARFPDFTEFKLESADMSRNFSQADLEQIVKICNEKLIYEMLFSDLFGGKPYEYNDAEFFIHKAQTGWQNNDGFIFLIRDTESNIIAAIDIKSAEDEAEVGYWISNEYPGIMTNAVKKLIEVARNVGYKKLWATTKLENLKSQNVLKRAGFTDLGEVERKSKQRRKFEIIL